MRETFSVEWPNKSKCDGDFPHTVADVFKSTELIATIKKKLPGEI